MEKYFSCKEVAEITGKSIRAVWNWCKSGKLKAGRPGGREYVIKESDLVEFLSEDNKNLEAKK